MLPDRSLDCCNRIGADALVGLGVHGIEHFIVRANQSWLYAEFGALGGQDLLVAHQFSAACNDAIFHA